MADESLQFHIPDPAEEAPQVPAPKLGALSGNPLVDFFNASGGAFMRGAQQGVSDISSTVGTLTDNQGLQDWAAKTSKDVQQSTPDYTGHPALGAMNAVATGLGEYAGPIVAGAATGAALTPPGEAVEGAAALAGSAAGAAGAFPVGFGSAKSEAIARGADIDTANRIGYESGALQSATFLVPMHQILQGGEWGARILKQAATNAGANAALSYGQEEIMKANDIRPLPDGGEFNNTLYSTLIGGVTGAIFGAFSPGELIGESHKIWDNVQAPAIQSQLQAEYVKQGMAPEQAAAKAVMDTENKRAQGIAQLQSMFKQAYFNKEKLLNNNYDIINKDKIPKQDISFYEYDRTEGGSTKEVPFSALKAPEGMSLEASRIINTHMAEMMTDKDGNVKTTDKSQFPLFKKTSTDTLPLTYRLALYNEVTNRLLNGETRSDILPKLQRGLLDVQDPNKFYMFEKPQGPEEEQLIWNPKMGVRKLDEVTDLAHGSPTIDLEKAKIVSMQKSDVPHGIWENLMGKMEIQKGKSFTQSPEAEPLQSPAEQPSEEEGAVPPVQEGSEETPIIPPETSQAHQRLVDAKKAVQDKEQAIAFKRAQDFRVAMTANYTGKILDPDVMIKGEDGREISSVASHDEAGINDLFDHLPGSDRVDRLDHQAVMDHLLEHAQLSKEEASQMAGKIVEMENEKPVMLSNDFVSKLIPDKGEVMKTENINADPANVRSLPLKAAFKTATMFGRKDQFLDWARSHYGNQFQGTFLTNKPADLAQSLVEAFKTDKQTMDLIHKIAADNCAGAQKVQWEIGTDIAKQLVQKGILKTAGLRDIQKVTDMFGEVESLASEEMLIDGSPSFIGKRQAFTPSGLPGTPDEWRQKNHFIKNYVEVKKFFGLPLEQSLDSRPEMAFTNILKEIAGDRGMTHLMWLKNELEDPSFQFMLKSGVLDKDSIQARVAYGFSVRVHDLGNLQKQKASEKRGGGNPTSSADVLQRKALDYSDFKESSLEQGLTPVTNYNTAMAEYIVKSLSMGLQYRTLSWLRGLQIPNARNLKLPKETAENRAIINKLNYVEYTTSDNIVSLAKINNMKPNDVLAHLGYYNKKDAEGLVAWNKFSFDKPFVQASLGDLIDWMYPHGALQHQGVSTFTRLTNIPKYMMVTLDPLQHMFLYSSSILANAGPRLPMVMGRFASTAMKALLNMPFAAASAVKGEAQPRFPLILGGGPIDAGYNFENAAKFMPHGFGAALGHSFVEGLFQDEKIARYLIPEMMTGAQVRSEAVRSTLSATKIMFTNWLSRELYYVTNARYNQFRTMAGRDGQLLMSDEEAARRAVQLVMAGAGTVHQSSFGPTGPAWSILTFARGLTIAPLRVISGITEPTLRKIYGQNSARFKVDSFSGALNPITMRDVSVKDADFLQAYYAQHLAKVIALRVMAAGVVQYAMSFLDDDKKDEFGQQGHDPMNKKRFIYNNPDGMKMGVRTPFKDINDRQIMLNPTPFREGAQLVDAAGLGSRYKFPESTVNWMKNRLNVWEGLLYGMANNVDLGTGQAIPGKDTDEWLQEMIKYLAVKVTPLSLGFTQEEKEERIPQAGAQTINQLGSFFGSTPMVAPKGWYPGYEDTVKVEKEYQLKREQEKEAVNQLTLQQVQEKKVNAFWTMKDKVTAEHNKNPNYHAQEVLKRMKMGRDLLKKEMMQQMPQQEEQAPQTVGQTGA